MTRTERAYLAAGVAVLVLAVLVLILHGITGQWIAW